MKKTLFEKLVEGTSLIKENKLEQEKFLTYEKLIHESKDENELNKCLNSIQVHPKFNHLIMKRFLEI